MKSTMSLFVCALSAPTSFAKDRTQLNREEEYSLQEEDIGNEYQFANLDAYGFGHSCTIKSNISFQVSGGYG